MVLLAPGRETGPMSRTGPPLGRESRKIDDGIGRGYANGGTFARPAQKSALLGYQKQQPSGVRKRQRSDRSPRLLG